MKSRGISLIEMVIAVAIGVIVMFFAGSLLFQSNKQLKKGTDKFYDTTLLNTVSGSLQKYMASGDLRFLAFMGTASPNKPVVRMIRPLVGKCGDLSTCNEDVSLLYVHYDKLTTPTVSVICNYQSPSAGNAFSWVWLVDLNNTNYGTAAIGGPNSFNIPGSASSTYVAGPVSVENGQLMALMNPPYATLWVSNHTGNLGTQSLTNVDPVDPTNAVGHTPIPAACVPNLQKSGANYLVDKLYKVRYRPYVISPKGKISPNIDDAMVASAQGIYPLRLFAAQLRTVGRRPVPPNNLSEFAITNCTLAVPPYSGSTVNELATCNGNPVASVPNVSKARIEEIFQVKLVDKPNAERFELVGPSGVAPQTATCDSPKCEPLTVNGPTPPTPDVVLDQPTTGSIESFDNLRASEFSYLKQEVLSRLRIKLVKTNGKEETFDTIFP